MWPEPAGEAPPANRRMSCQCAYNPLTRRPRASDHRRFDRGHQTLSLSAVGTRLTPDVGIRLSRESTMAGPPNNSAERESALRGRSDGHRTSDQMVGGSNPSGRANL
jgi:hypothetical protein